MLLKTQFFITLLLLIMALPMEIFGQSEISASLEYTNAQGEKMKRTTQVEGNVFSFSLYLSKEGKNSSSWELQEEGKVDLSTLEGMAKSTRSIKKKWGKSQTTPGIGFNPPQGPTLFFEESDGQALENRDQLMQNLFSLSQTIRAEKLMAMDKYRPCVQKEAGGSAFEQAILTLINQHRVKKGLKPLLDHPHLREVARGHSQYLADNALPSNHHGVKGRYEKIGKSLAWSKVAENVADNQGHSDPAKSAYKQWKHSPGHYENMLIQWEGDRQGHTGIGVVESNGHYYFTQVFADDKGIGTGTGTDETKTVDGKNTGRPLPNPKGLKAGIPVLNSEIKRISKNIGSFFQK